MIVLGLTGSVGMGKSTAAQMLRKLGVPVHDSDEAARKATDPDGVAVAEVAKIFPEAYVKKNNAIDRTVLGPIVFNDPAKRKVLEEIVHPHVIESQQTFLKEQRRHNVGIMALDIPLLYETGAERRVNKVIVVTAPFYIQRRRVLARPGMTEDKFRSIVGSQMPDGEKRARADFVVTTGLGMTYTYFSLKKIIKSLAHGQNRHSLPPHDR